MTRVVRNKTTGKFINIDPILNEGFEYDEPHQATIFNEEIDEMTDADVLEHAKNACSGDADLEILPVKITVEILDEQSV